MKFIDASKSTLRKFSISSISDFDLVVMFEGMNTLSEFKVVGNDDFSWETLDAMIVKDRRMVTAMSEQTDDEDRDEEGSEILLPNLEALHVICKTYFQVQKSFLNVVRSRWWPEDDSRDRAVVRLKTASLQSISEDERPVFGAEADDPRCQGLDIEMLAPEGPLENEVGWVLGQQN